ncbi:sensor histidine kinase [Microbacterium sp. SA39]|uniref:sensor histidine kinase n=1 Tax=Microbacterium sp. SA39 TaxID=1263625 RepID=UPI000697CA3E|nr:histidine kinase [Microbacterium sp. SA39]
MKRTRSRSDSIREDEELRLPRAPGLFRRFWARHPVFADVVIVGICLLLSSTTVGITEIPQELPASDVPPFIFPVLMVAASLTLLVRRRHPLVPFVAGCMLAMVLMLLPSPGGPPLPLFACYALAVYGSTRAAWTAFAIGTTTVTATALLLMGLNLITLQGGIDSMLSIVVFGLIGTLIGVNVGERKRYLTALIDRSRQLLVERDQQARLAAAAERARIAREMHDIVSHSLTVIVALSEGAVSTPDHTQARMAAASAAQTARGALTEMRSMLGVLRDVDSPAPLAPLEPTPPHDTVAAAQRAGFPATLTVIGSAEVCPAVAHAVGRIVQEGVTNAMRHAPTATAIAVRVDYTPETVTIEIANDGVSGPVGNDGFGARGLAERAAHVGGHVRSEADGGGRWLLRAELPTGDIARQPDATEESG